MMIDFQNGDPRDALAFASLIGEVFCVGVVKSGDRRIAICDWEGDRVALLLRQALLDQDPGLAGTLTYVNLMTPEVIPAPTHLLALFDDPAFTGCRFLVHEDDPTAAWRATPSRMP